MSKRTGPTKVKLSDFKERKELEGAIDVETDDGQVFRIPPPEVWPDEVNDITKGDRDAVRMAQVILGADQYEKFCAAGGNAAMLHGIFAEVHGASPGE